jgi:glycerophosphoryl diester phosphodiesterase
MLIIGHRGVPKLAPENTIESFEKALELNTDGLELDVQLTKDNIPVVIHDETLERTTNGSGFVKDYNYKELRKLDAGSYFSPDYKGAKIPALEEVLEMVSKKNIYFNIEIKSGIIKYAGIEEIIINLLEKYNYINNTVLSSFNHYCLIECKKINKEIKTGVLYFSGIVDPWEYAKKINADYIHPFKYSFNLQIVKLAHKNKIKIFPFVINKINLAKKLKSWEVDGIFSDCSSKIKQFLK